MDESKRERERERERELPRARVGILKREGEFEKIKFSLWYLGFHRTFQR